MISSLDGHAPIVGTMTPHLTGKLTVDVRSGLHYQHTFKLLQLVDYSLQLACCLRSCTAYTFCSISPKGVSAEKPELLSKFLLHSTFIFCTWDVVPSFKGTRENEEARQLASAKHFKYDVL